METPVGKKKFALKPCNDPSRECWDFFRHVFAGDEDHPQPQPSAETLALLESPADAQAARDRLRMLLQKAFAEKPWRVLRMSLLGSAKGSMKGALKAFVAHLNARGVDLTTAALARNADVDEDTNFGSVGWRTAFEYLASRMHSMTDGPAVISRIEKYRKLGTSTNEPIKAWLPEEGGVVTYLRERTRHILLAYYEKDRDGHKVQFRSLDQMQEIGIELDNEAKIHRRLKTDQEHDVDDPEVAMDLGAGGASPSLQKTSDAEPESDAAGGTSAGSEELAKEPNEKELLADAKNALRARIDNRIEELKADPNAKGDWPLRLFDAGYGVDDVSPSVDVTRKAAKRLLSRLRHADETLETDYQEILTLIDEWDGKTPLVQYLPELPEYATKYRYSLKGVDELPVAVRSTCAPSPAELQLASKATVAGAIVQQMLGMQVPTPADSAQVHQAFAAQTIALRELLLSEYDPELLEDCERNDYSFLCAATGTAKLQNLDPGELHAEMRNLAALWTARMIDGADAQTTEFALRLRGWDPAQEHISGPINRAVYEMVKAQLDVGEPSAERTVATEVPSRQMGFEMSF